MKKQFFILLTLPCLLFACSTQPTETDSSQTTSTETSSQVTVQSFSDWLAEQNHPHADLILDNLDQLTTEEIVNKVAENTQVSLDNISIAYHEFGDDSYYYYNEDKTFIAASTTKVLKTMLYTQAIEAGDVTLDTEIPYHNSYYQDGDGDITYDATTGKATSSYPLKDVIYQTLYYSDNTANSMLRYYYDYLYGDGAMFRDLSQLMDGKWTAEEAAENTIDVRTLEYGIAKLAQDDRYADLIPIMTQSEAGRFSKKYIIGDMASKYGALYDYLHHLGVYYVAGQPAYDIIIFSDGLGEGNANEFMGQLNLQLATRAQYRASQK